MSIRRMKKRDKRNLLKNPLIACDHANIHVMIDEEKNTVMFEVCVRSAGRRKVRFSRKLIRRITK